MSALIDYNACLVTAGHGGIVFTFKLTGGLQMQLRFSVVRFKYTPFVLLIDCTRYVHAMYTRNLLTNLYRTH
jgi:hypothetical protein